jgi:phosphohistidine phosphatase SixA
MRRLELRRHAHRNPSADRLSAKGRAQAEDLGRAAGLTEPYTNVFVSPAGRAAETAAWILRGGYGSLPPDHAVIPGLAGTGSGGGSPEAMVAGVKALLDQVPEGGRGLAISHTPFVERAALGLTGREPAPFAECEGILVTALDDGTIAVEELRLGGEVA